MCERSLKYKRGSYNVPGGLSVVNSEVLHVRRKPLVQPQVIPPLQSHQVAKPLKKHNTLRAEIPNHRSTEFHNTHDINF